MPELPELAELDPAAARDWIVRWDRQQEVYLPTGRNGSPR